MNCQKCMRSMSDAATEGLSEQVRAEFEAHVQKCSSCREEFERVNALVGAIDRGVVERAAIEPSAELATRVRRRIASEAAPSKWNWASWVPAVVCAATVVIAAAIFFPWPRGAKPSQVAKTTLATDSAAPASHEVQQRASGNGEAISASARPPGGFVARAQADKQHRMKHELTEPQVIVPAGEAETVFQLVAALQSGKLDGAKLVADLKSASQPIEIKPLVIEPLETTAQADDKGSGPGSDGKQKDFVSGEPTRGLVP